MEKYLLQKSTERQNVWIVTDTVYGIVVQFEEGKFNETQKVSFLEEPNEPALSIARKLRELSEWIIENHPEVIFKKNAGK